MAGRVLLSGHDPHWLRDNLGVRVSYHQSRRAWKVGNNAALGTDVAICATGAGTARCSILAPITSTTKARMFVSPKPNTHMPVGVGAIAARSPLRPLKSRTVRLDAAP
jgi:hypothetical protein